MKIALLGATGNLGSHTLRSAVAAGHQVTAYARRPEAVEHLPGVTVIGGELDDVPTLSSAISGAEVLVVSITGPMKDTTFCRRTVPGILTAAHEAAVAHVLLVSAFGAGETAGKASLPARLMYRTALKGFFGDKAAAEQLVHDSGLPWTIVYPVNLKEAAAQPGQTIEPIDTVTRVPGLPTLPFANAARALVEIAEQSPDTDGRRLLVTTTNGWRR